MCKECKVRDIFLKELPKWGKNAINWKTSIGYKVKFIYDDIQGEVEIVNYDGKYLYIKYLNRKPFKILTGSFQKCKLGKLLNKITNDFKVEIETRFKDKKRDITIIDRKYKERIKKKEMQKWYKYKCNKCGWTEGWIEENNLLNGDGCSCCCSAPKTVVPGINDIATTAPWMVKYFVNPEEAKKYNRCSVRKVQVKCPECDKIKEKPMAINDIYRNHSIGCKYCGDGVSYPEKFMLGLLKQLNINFQYQYSPKWISPKRYDFYCLIQNKNYIIEMDGALGHGKKSYNKSKKESKMIDDYKDKLADEHGIKVIRIDCDKSELKYIKDNILKSNLNNLFDLSKIDWIKIEEFALNNLVKKACELKKNNPNMNTLDIGNIMNLNRQTIIKYLKKGSKIWDWCKYDPKGESIKAHSKAGKMSGKPVEILKNGISLGEFESCHDLVRQSEKLFGTKLDYSNISCVCNGKRKTHKGFTFKYIESPIKNTPPNSTSETSINIQEANKKAI